MNNISMINSRRELAWFCRDHYNGLMVVCTIRRQLRLKIDAHAIAAYIKQEFNDNIEKHFYEEERWLFPKLQVKDVLRVPAEQQHAALRKIVRTMDVAEDITAAAGEFADMLEEHIRFEERTLFPHLEQQLSKKTRPTSTVNPAGFIGV
jgi:hemerythrin-like domain-containing protein